LGHYKSILPVPNLVIARSMRKVELHLDIPNIFGKWNKLKAQWFGVQRSAPPRPGQIVWTELGQLLHLLGPNSDKKVREVGDSAWQRKFNDVVALMLVLTVKVTSKQQYECLQGNDDWKQLFDVVTCHFRPSHISVTVKRFECGESGGVESRACRYKYARKIEDASRDFLLKQST
jgi:hypothetical protein